MLLPINIFLFGLYRGVYYVFATRGLFVQRGLNGGIAIGIGSIGNGLKGDRFRLSSHLNATSYLGGRLTSRQVVMQEGGVILVGHHVGSCGYATQNIGSYGSSTTQSRSLFQVFNVSSTLGCVTIYRSTILDAKGLYAYNGSCLPLGGVGAYCRFHGAIFGLRANIRFRGMRIIIRVGRGFGYTYVSVISYLYHLGDDGRRLFANFLIGDKT